MLKKIWNYQLLLGNSIGVSSEKASFKLNFLRIFIYILFLFSLSLIIGDGGLILYPTVFTLYAIYSKLNSQTRLFEAVPVSSLYSLVNIYLYVFISIIFSTTLLLIVVKLFTKLNFTSDIGQLVNSFQTILLIFIIPTIIVSVLMPLFFIRHNLLRLSLTIFVVILFLMVLILIKSTLPTVIEFSKTDFWRNITLVPGYNKILLLSACASVITIPISILSSYKIYKGKRCSSC